MDSEEDKGGNLHSPEWTEARGACDPDWQPDPCRHSHRRQRPALGAWPPSPGDCRPSPPVLAMRLPHFSLGTQPPLPDQPPLRALARDTPSPLSGPGCCWLSSHLADPSPQQTQSALPVGTRALQPPCPSQLRSAGAAS